MRKFFPATYDSVRLENEVGDALGRSRVDDQRDLESLVEHGVLVPLDGLWVSNKLPLNRRYALPQTVEYVRKLDALFYAEFGKHLIVTSAVRPITVQKKLLRWNRNAAPAKGERASSHERGTTIDIGRRKLTREQYRWLVFRLMYDRALHRVLVIEEKACFHIFVGGLNDEETGRQGAEDFACTVENVRCSD